MTQLIAGVDGCPGGWVATVAGAGNPASARLVYVTDLATFLETVRFALIDMPIGFASGPDPRDVEPAMRALLKGKASSVFPTPCRMALAEPTYLDASFVNREILGKYLTKQTFMLFPKMREIDALAQTLGQSRLREGHPEVSFAVMAGAPVLSKKRQPQGQADRAALLDREGLPTAALLAARIKGKMAADDILDSAAMWWSANRFLTQTHLTLPAQPSKDAAGLEMSVVA